MLHDLKEFFLIPVEFFQRASKLTYCSLGVAAVVGILYFAIMFDRRSNFVTAETYDKCDNAFHGRRHDYSKAVAKLFFLLIICMVSYHLACRQLPECVLPGEVRAQRTPELFRRLCRYSISKLVCVPSRRSLRPWIWPVVR